MNGMSTSHPCLCKSGRRTHSNIACNTNVCDNAERHGARHWQLCGQCSQEFRQVGHRFASDFFLERMPAKYMAVTERNDSFNAMHAHASMRRRPCRGNGLYSTLKEGQEMISFPSHENIRCLNEAHRCRPNTWAAFHRGRDSFNTTHARASMRRRPCRGNDSYLILKEGQQMIFIARARA